MNIALCKGSVANSVPDQAAFDKLKNNLSHFLIWASVSRWHLTFLLMRIITRPSVRIFFFITWHQFAVIE